MSDPSSMSDHTWTQENATTFLAGGLTADENVRFEGHISACPPCAALVDDARRLDQRLTSLFAPIRPGPDLEDFTILKLREARGVSWKMALPRRARRALAALAALLLIGTFGGLIASLVTDGQLPLPGGANLEFARGHVSAEAETFLKHKFYAVNGLDEPLDRNGRASGPADLEASARGRFDNDKPDPDASEGGQSVPAPRDSKPNRPSFPQGDVKSWTYQNSPGGPGRGSGLGVAGFPGGGGPAPGSGFGGGGLGGGLGGLGGGLGGLGGGIAGGLGGIGGFSGGTPPGPMGQPGQLTGPQYSPAYDPIVKPTQIPGDVYTAIPKLTVPAGEGEQKDNTLRYFQPGNSKPAADNSREQAAGKDPKREGDKAPGEPKSSEKGDPKPKDDGGREGQTKKNAAPAPADPEPSRRIVIRSGDMEFEVASFDASLELITKLVTGIKGAFVATVNSEKLPNGKVMGSITIRTPPEALDELVLTLRRELGKTGELKGVKISSQDITKMYTDLESRLRAARTMETRLIQIIKEGKGEIKQLLEAERELGVWRTKIEEFEGEIRYYANLAALSTLTITLTEKEIRAAAGLTEKERVQAGVEVEDVDKAYQQVLAAIVEAKGRVTKSELKQLSAGQFNATLNFEVAPEAAGPIRDRLRQLGRVARLEIDRVQSADGTLPSNAKLTRGDTVFLVQLYNLANIAPRETATLQVAVADVPAAYQALRDAVAKTTGRVLVAQLNEQDKQNVNAQFDFEVKRTDEGTVRAAIEAAGEIVSRLVTRAPESDSVTDIKILYRATILAASRLKPRETATYAIAVADVSTAYQVLRDATAKTTARVINAQFDEHDKQNVTAQFDFEVKRGDEAAVRAALEAAGEIISRQVNRSPEGDGQTDKKVLYRAALFGVNRLHSRDTTILQLAVTDVPPTYQSLRETVLKLGGRILTGQLDEHDKQAITAQLDFEIKRAEEPAVRSALESVGDVIARQVTRASEAEGVTDAKVTYRATLLTASRLRPRELMTLVVEVPDVEQSATVVAAQAAEAKARAVDARISREASGKVTAHLLYDVPLSAAAELAEQFKKAGTVRIQQSVRDPQAPEGKYAIARLELTLTSADRIVDANGGVWPPVKRGLTYSASVLLTSLTWVVFGLCVILPWALIGFGGYRVVRWMGRPSNPATPAT